MKVGPKNMVQIIINNAAICKAPNMLTELESPSVY